MDRRRLAGPVVALLLLGAGCGDTDEVRTAATDPAGPAAVTEPPPDTTAPSADPTVPAPAADGSAEACWARGAEVALEPVDPWGFVVWPGPDDRLYCLGPPLLHGTAVESVAIVDAPDPALHLVLFEGPEGIDRFNALAAACSARAERCPTGMLAVTLEQRVLVAPTVQAPEFERDQIVVAAGEHEIGTLAARLREDAAFRPVLAVLPPDQ